MNCCIIVVCIHKLQVRIILYSTSSAITNLNVNFAIHNSTNVYMIVVEKCHIVVSLCCSCILDDQ